MTKRLEPVPFFGMLEVDDDDVYPMTQQEVADELGISRPAVGSTEKRAMQRLGLELQRLKSGHLK